MQLTALHCTTAPVQPTSSPVILPLYTLVSHPIPPALHCYLLSLQLIEDHPWLVHPESNPSESLQDGVIARFKRFAAANKLKKRVMLMLGAELPPDQVEGLR